MWLLIGFLGVILFVAILTGSDEVAEDIMDLLDDIADESED